MSALYEIKYQGVAGTGHGAFYIGRGRIVGIDITGARYNGGYAVHGAELVGQAMLTATANSPLVTGQTVAAGTEVPINFTLPQSFEDGRFYPVTVAGQRVNIAFNKVGDVP